MPTENRNRRRGSNEKSFSFWLTANGYEILPPSKNEWEILRWRLRFDPTGEGVIHVQYKNKRGMYSWSDETARNLYIRFFNEQRDAKAATSQGEARSLEQGGDEVPSA